MVRCVGEKTDGVIMVNFPSAPAAAIDFFAVGVGGCIFLAVWYQVADDFSNILFFLAVYTLFLVNRGFDVDDDESHNKCDDDDHHHLGTYSQISCHFLNHEFCIPPYLNNVQASGQVADWPETFYKNLTQKMMLFNAKYVNNCRNRQNEKKCSHSGIGNKGDTMRQNEKENNKSGNRKEEMRNKYYVAHYKSPLGDLALASDGDSLVGLWLDGQKYFAASVRGQMEDEESLPVLHDTKRWLDRYFAGEKPQIGELPLAPAGSAFRQQVWKLLEEIPYGAVVAYKDLAEAVAEKLGRETMSAQAIGQAVGHNPISIIIPCHRVIGKNGSLTGYAGGIDKKIWLLEHEGVDLSAMTVPAK